MADLSKKYDYYKLILYLEIARLESILWYIFIKGIIMSLKNCHVVMSKKS